MRKFHKKFDEFHLLSEKGKKNLFRLLFSRTAIITILLLIQFLLLFLFFNLLSEYIVYFMGGSTIISMFMILYLMNNYHNNSVKISWIVVITVIPLFGTILYWYIHTDLGYRLLKKRLIDIYKNTEDVIQANENVYKKISDKKIYNLSQYMLKQGNYKAFNNTNVEYFKTGESMFYAMLHELEKAEKYIFLEYFILEEGTMWGKILNILKQKANEGVEVRVMYDGTCAFSLLPYSYPKKLEQLNIKAKMFAPIKPFLSTHYNNRDHRKILVIDGKVAFTGGINIADEYINEKQRFGYWKDTGVLLKGDAVSSFTLMFLKMWNVSEAIEDNYSKYLNVTHNIKNDSIIIPYGETPFDNELFSKSIYMDIINNASNYVYISTPYLILDSELENAIILASKKGIDVRLILPHIADSPYPFALAHNHYKALIESGAKVYEYKPGFVHAKMILSDDTTSIIGTINFDYRSLYHNFECATFINNSECIKDIKHDFNDMIKKSILVDNEFIKNDKIFRKILGKLLKIVAPLM